MDDDRSAPGFDPATYGRSFADVYDDWYPPDDATAAATGRLSEIAHRGLDHAGRPRILELGVGTGRLALPLAAAGHDVVGLDSSPEMLAALDANAVGATAVGGPAVETALGDVAVAADWPSGPFDLVVAAFNLLFNLVDADAQRSTFRSAQAALRSGGHLVVETFVPAPIDRRERRLDVREVTASSVVLMATDSDPELGVVTGQHIELRDGEPVRLRPWRICVASVADLDRWAAAAGLDLVERTADWDGTVFDPHGDTHVSVYRRPG